MMCCLARFSAIRIAREGRKDHLRLIAVRLPAKVHRRGKARHLIKVLCLDWIGRQVLRGAADLRAVRHPRALVRV
jgi:hypothetical protein